MVECRSIPCKSYIHTYHTYSVKYELYCMNPTSTPPRSIIGIGAFAVTNLSFTSVEPRDLPALPAYPLSSRRPSSVSSLLCRPSSLPIPLSMHAVSALGRNWLFHTPESRAANQKILEHRTLHLFIYLFWESHESVCVVTMWLVYLFFCGPHKLPFSSVSAARGRMPNA